MSPLKLTPAEKAGPKALGILTPPGPRTILILRPRSMNWDLVLLQGVAEVRFREMSQSEARNIAEAVFKSLQSWSEGGAGELSPVPNAWQDGFQVWLDLGEHSLILCARIPGEPYLPFSFSDQSEASGVCDQLRPSLIGSIEEPQEVYFNVRHFG